MEYWHRPTAPTCAPLALPTSARRIGRTIVVRRPMPACSDQRGASCARDTSGMVAGHSDHTSVLGRLGA